MPQAEAYGGEGDAACQNTTDGEAEKVAVVGVPDTVIDPGAMVIHFEDAGATNGAVMRPGRLVLAALLAVPRLPRRLLQLRGDV